MSSSTPSSASRWSKLMWPRSKPESAFSAPSEDAAIERAPSSAPDFSDRNASWSRRPDDDFGDVGTCLPGVLARCSASNEPEEAEEDFTSPTDASVAIAPSSEGVPTS